MFRYVYIHFCTSTRQLSSNDVYRTRCSKIPRIQSQYFLSCFKSQQNVRHFHRKNNIRALLSTGGRDQCLVADVLIWHLNISIAYFYLLNFWMYFWQYYFMCKNAVLQFIIDIEKNKTPELSEMLYILFTLRTTISMSMSYIGKCWFVTKYYNNNMINAHLCPSVFYSHLP